MKKLFSLCLMVACFTFIASSSLSAQNLVKNYTDCDFKIKVSYGLAGSCTSTGTLIALIPAGGTVLLPMPSGTEIIAAKGYNESICTFYVGQSSCTIYSETTEVDCPGQCGDYIAVMDPTIGMKFGNL